MNEILHQLGSLMVGSVPTIVLFVLLIAAYNLLVQGPLTRTLTERSARTTGAVEQARGAISAAEAETSVYEDKLRAAKSEIFALREQRLAAWAGEREQTLQAVRDRAAQQMQAARSSIESSTADARGQIEAASGDLAARILAAVLPAGAREAVQ